MISIGLLYRFLAPMSPILLDIRIQIVIKRVDKIVVATEKDIFNVNIIAYLGRRSRLLKMFIGTEKPIRAIPKAADQASTRYRNEQCSTYQFLLYSRQMVLRPPSSSNYK